MKRIIRMAKDQGYDYVAWSPGEVHIPRYNLSQVAKELIVTKAKQPEGSNQLDTFNITAKTHHGGERNFEIKESQLFIECSDPIKEGLYIMNLSLQHTIHVSY